MSKGKVNPNKMPLTKMDMKLAEKKWQEQLDQMKIEATSNASLFVQAVVYLALCNKLGFGVDELEILRIESERISERIGATEGKDKNYSLDSVRKDLKKYNVFIEGEWL